MEKFNYYRKLWHLVGLIIPVLFYLDPFNGALGLEHASRAIVFSILFLNTVLLSIIEVLRLNFQSINENFWTYFGKLMKEQEKGRITATLPYILSNAFVVAFFPAELACLSMCFLLIGDPSAAFFGSKYGKFRFKNGKSRAGVVAFIGASFVSGLLLMLLFANSNGNPFYALYANNALNHIGIIIMLAGVLSAAAAEFYSGHAWNGFLDDNLTIPFASSIVMVVLTILFYNIGSLDQVIFPVTEMFR